MFAESWRLLDCSEMDSLNESNPMILNRWSDDDNNHNHAVCPRNLSSEFKIFARLNIHNTAIEDLRRGQWMHFLLTQRKVWIIENYSCNIFLRLKTRFISMCKSI